MQVKKRDGSMQDLDFEKIHWRIKSMCCKNDILEFQRQERPDAYNVFSQLPALNVTKEDIDMIAQKTVAGVYNGISTTQIDLLSAEIAQDMSISNPDNSTLATRILVSNMQKNIREIITRHFNHVNSEEVNNNL